jgi:hypothetical protein
MAADQRQELLLHRQPEIAVTGQLNPAVRWLSIASISR